MEYNLAELRRTVRVDLLDDDEYDPDIVDRALNRAQRNIFNQYELSFMEKIFSGDIPQGRYMVAYPEDLALAQSHVISAPDGSQKSMDSRYIPYKDFNRMYPTPGNSKPGNIVHWTSYGGNIILSNPTDKEYTLDVYYIRKPAKLLADTDVPSIPEEFEEALTLGAYLRIAKRNEDLDLYQIAMQDYQEQILQMVNRYGMRKDGPIKMKNMQRR